MSAGHIGPKTSPLASRNKAEAKPDNAQKPEPAKSEPAAKRPGRVAEQLAGQDRMAGAAQPPAQGQNTAKPRRAQSKQQLFAKSRGTSKSGASAIASSAQGASRAKGTEGSSAKFDPAAPTELRTSESQRQPPNGLILPYDLTNVSESRLLERTGGRGALYAVGEWRPGAQPLVLVHGANADFRDLQAVIDRFRNDPSRQLLVYAYDDQNRFTADNGVDLSRALARYSADYPWATNLDIVAHSMGGLVTRRALNEMTWGQDRGLVDAFKRVRLLAVDSPWHGFRGPGLRMPFRQGAMDLQASSGMFMGDPRGSTEAERMGLLTGKLPQHVEVELVSADQRAANRPLDTILDYTDQRTELPWSPANPSMAHLRESLVDFLWTGRIPTPREDLGDRAFSDHYLRAMMQDEDWPRAEAQLRQRLNEQGPDGLTASYIAQVLGQAMPRYAGTHAGVMRNPQLLDDIQQRLR